jgi:hypothetical protein
MCFGLVLIYYGKTDLSNLFKMTAYHIQLKETQRILDDVNLHVIHSLSSDVCIVGGRCLSRGKCATKFRYGSNVQPQCQRNNQIQLERSSHNPLVNSLQSVFNVHQPTFTKGLAGIDLNRVNDKHRTSTVRCGAVQQQGTQEGRH